jgi:hypothetical protein
VQAFVRGKRAQRPRPHPLRPPGGAAPTAGTPALERHTVISSLVRLTCVISLLIDIGPHVLACSSAELSALPVFRFIQLAHVRSHSDGPSIVPNRLRTSVAPHVTVREASVADSTRYQGLVLAPESGGGAAHMTLQISLRNLEPSL